MPRVWMDGTVAGHGSYLTPRTRVLNAKLANYIKALLPLNVVDRVVVVDKGTEITVWNVLKNEFPPVDGVDNPGYDHLGDVGADLIDGYEKFAEVFITNINPSDFDALMASIREDGVSSRVLSVE